MKRNYYNKDDKTLAFIKALKEHTGPLTLFFRRWANQNDLAEGSVRNFYYKIAQKSREDKDFCNKYLDGKPLNVTRGVCFSKSEEIDLISAVEKGKSMGKSVRSVVVALANGSAQKALRLQNKYRNVLRQQKQDKPVKKYFNESQYSLIKDGIDNLVSKLHEKSKIENQDLKRQIYFLQIENLRLKAQLGAKRESAIDILLGSDLDGAN